MKKKTRDKKSLTLHRPENNKKESQNYFLWSLQDLPNKKKNNIIDLNLLNFFWRNLKYFHWQQMVIVKKNSLTKPVVFKLPDFFPDM